VHPRAVAHDDTPRSLRGEGLIAHTTVLVLWIFSVSFIVISPRGEK
jgi:hypothetical protein